MNSGAYVSAWLGLCLVLLPLSLRRLLLDWCLCDLSFLEKRDLQETHQSGFFARDHPLQDHRQCPGIHPSMFMSGEAVKPPVVEIHFVLKLCSVNTAIEYSNGTEMKPLFRLCPGDICDVD